MQKQIYRLMIVASCAISSLASANYTTYKYKTVDNRPHLTTLPTVAMYPYAVQPSASIGYQGSKAHIGIHIPLGQRVYVQSNYQLPSLPALPHYQQIEQIHLPYGGTYTKKTEVIPQNPVYVQPHIVLPAAQRVVISQGSYVGR